MNIKEFLKNTKIITDGSFGTYYSMLYNTDEMAEVANTKYAERVIRIHEEYLKAGANLIRTNTFASNTIFLDTNFELVENNILAGINNAKIAVDRSLNKSGNESVSQMFIAGDIGPIPFDLDDDIQKIEEEYYRIVKLFIENGINIINFETFNELSGILPVIKRIKSEHDVFIMVSFCVNQYGYSNAGVSAYKLINEAKEVIGIDAIGLNCGIGPGHMKKIVDKMNLTGEKFFIALPNAGYPKRVRGIVKFDNNTDYFAKKICEMVNENNIDIVGGCCGTNPDFIYQLKKELDVKQKERSIITVQSFDESRIVEKTSFFRDYKGCIKNKKLIAVELAPPANDNDVKVLEAAKLLKNMEIDVVTFPDSPSGRTRIDSVLMADKVKKETGLNVMPHICCRDKNAIAMRSLFMGAMINDISNFLLITGDPVPSMARQTVKQVFNFDSVGLMNIAKDMNMELFTKNQLTYGGAINQGRKNLDVEINRVLKKMDSGAEFFFTQPVFGEDDALRIKKIKDKTGARILCGIMPLISRKNALFMKNEISGINVSDEIINRYPENAEKEENEKIAIDIAKEMMGITKEFTDGYYFSFPFNRVSILQEILE
ncbi:MAG: bifunctional homocysteine S-methyltransferase/methylenetetrahydrofolate reductase [Lachnospiraceae bacterium]|nr:bifunctional homocysteine S-methyltransferase/methylenetetrahydrofolate reductase [Lachnospiraceae bacterium]